MPSPSRYSIDLINQSYSRGQLQFQGLDLRNLSLEGMRLPFVEFVDCNLQGLNLAGAFMPGGVFSHSCLRKCRLNWANLIGTDFFRADLSALSSTAPCCRALSWWASICKGPA
jgi:uncharacterized protein YjbI with pentapeptide repeats